MKRKLLATSLSLTGLFLTGCVSVNFSESQLAQWLKTYPQADTDGDGRLSQEEAAAHRKEIQGRGSGVRRGVQRTFEVDPGWSAERFPEHAMCYRTPEALRKAYPKWASFEKPDDGALRIVATGHSFMAPGFKALPGIGRLAGFEQTLLTHTSGGMKGSARYKWEEENGIFGFEGERPKPKLLASIANGDWDAMMWGPYFNDRPEFYACWIDYCLKYHPDMKFFLSDAWPSIQSLDKQPESEEELTHELFDQLGEVADVKYEKLMSALNAKYPDKVFILPTSAAMILAVKHYHRGELPGVEGIHRAVGKKKRSLWSDPLGHLGPGLGRLEGYVFYATMYGKSPELLVEDEDLDDKSFPSRALDRVFRKIAWEAVVDHPLSGVTDKDGDGLSDKAS